ncbi:hypothetical protein C8R43DRAFT_1024409 [Mycena crocata]|nr:hypothetical protein C8R43DRAFT_1024409 [Mycena crocata]
MKRIQEKVGRTFRRFSRAPAVVKASPDVITGDPILPPELEREIFELAAAMDAPPDYWTHQHVGDIVLVLPQVCRRVQAWIEPLIYERISLLYNFNGRDPVPRFLETVDARPANFFATHVKYLYFDSRVPLPAAQHILSVCTGIVTFGCHHPYTALAPLLAPLPLKRLLVSEFTFPSTAGDTPPWAASLTHLGLSVALPPDPSALFVHLPVLTHLAVDFDTLPDPETPGMGAALVGLLSAGARIRYIVLATGTKTDYKWTFQRLRQDGFSDVRLDVHLRPVQDGTWDAWSRRVPDMFAHAEKKGRRPKT